MLIFLEVAQYVKAMKEKITICFTKSKHTRDIQGIQLEKSCNSSPQLLQKNPNTLTQGAIQP